MTNQRRKIKIITNAFFYFAFACLLFYIDISMFSIFQKPFSQFLLCAYIVLLTKQRSALFLSPFVLLLSLESLVFFGQIEYLLFFTLLAYVSVRLFKELIQISVAIPLIALSINLLTQKFFFIIYLSQSHNDFLYTIGHFCFNLLFLIIYWIFENNGK